MSVQQGNFGDGGGGAKKAVHVKWAGKTIALGTFPSAEADEKCARAKALTRAWRSTMRPKPTRDWVMLELERLGVRVVSGRLGRKAGEDDGPEKKAAAAALNLGAGPGPGTGTVTGPGNSIDRRNSLGWASGEADLNTLMQRRNSSLGLAMLNDSQLQRRQSLGSLGQVVGLDGNDSGIPPHRPLVGGGAAAAFEAMREDFYAQQNAGQQRRASLGLGNIGGNLGSSGISGIGGLSVNPNQHYEMLKLHHMNLLNEIQETTLMMNLYQQQQLQQQQQHLKQQANLEQMNKTDSQMALLLQQQQQQQQQNGGTSNSNLDQMFGGGGLSQQRNSIGLGGNSVGKNNQMEQLLRQQQQLIQGNSAKASAPQELLKGQQEQAALQERLQKLKEDIARREKAEDMQKMANASGGDNVGDKRKRENGVDFGNIGKSGPKHSKLENGVGNVATKL